jgi:hypothetical protein
MIRLSTMYWLTAVATAGFAMFAVKYEVQGLSDQLARTTKQADGVERDLRALSAEWAYLNRPDALAQLNQQLLSLGPIATKQLRASLADIPMRPVPMPPPAPDPAIGAVQVVSPGALPPPVPAAAAAIAEASVSSATPAAAPPMPVSPGSSPPLAPPTPSDEPLIALDAPPPTSSPPTTRPGAAAPVKSAAHANRLRRPASLDELIAQVSESR